MPVRLFTDAERERLNRFPRDVPPGDVLTFFTLSDADLELLADRRGDQNRLGLSVQLTALRYLGFAPDDLTSAPARVVSYLALQLNVPATALAQYAIVNLLGPTTCRSSRCTSASGMRGPTTSPRSPRGWSSERSNTTGRSSCSSWPASGCATRPSCDLA